MAKKALWIVTIAAIGTLVLSVYMYWMAYATGFTEDMTFLAYTNIVIVAWAVLGAVCFGLALGSFGLKSSPGKVWLCFTIGIACWAIGDIIYMYITVIAPVAEDFPSLGDYFWSLGYGFVFVGIFLQMRLAPVKLTKVEVIVVLIVVAVSVIVAVYYVIWPVLEKDLLLTEYPIDYWIFSLDYPILDLILIPLAIILAMKYRGGEFSKAWLIIAIGFIVTATYDLLYTYFELMEEGYILYTDIIYIGYYILLGIGALYLRASLQKLK